MNDLLNTILNDLWVSPSACVKTYSYSTPRVDVKENKDSYTLEMDLPGRSEEDIEIELNKDNLTIASKPEKKTENKEEIHNKSVSHKEEKEVVNNQQENQEITIVFPVLKT